MHVGGQEIPGGSLTMLAAPVPPRTTRTSSGVKRATSEVESRLSVTAHGPVPAQRWALQPRNVLVAAAVAVAVTTVPGT